MNAQRWRQIKRIYGSVLEREPERREAFLDEACAGDETLRKEVASLLAEEGKSEGLLDSPALDAAAKALANDEAQEPRPDLTGQTLSHYRILAKIGEGGMGVVYRAEDTNLNRQVAIKVLADTFLKDQERLARFEREAKLLALLNHPNIAAIYGLERTESTPLLIMELVQGKTLAERLAKGPLPVAEALKVSAQIAEGLEAAHERGIVHRDLKPANVKITPEGQAKILDFGLAKALRGEPDLAEHSTELSNLQTRTGVILGTAAYMSPEQANGRAVDKRADIWAFGCILFECLTGKRAFQGQTTSEMVAAILKEEPDWDLLPATAIQPVKEVVRRCLEKDPRKRLRDIGDARIEIDEELSRSEVGQVVSTRKPTRAEGGRSKQPGRLLVVLGFLLIAVGVAVVIYLKTTAVNKPAMVRLALEFPPGITPSPGRTTGVVLSPDGSHIAYVAKAGNGPRKLCLRPLGSLENRILEGTENASSPFWASDNRSIGFFSERKLKKVDISGGSVQTICETPSLAGIGGTWSPDGAILFGSLEGPVFRVAAGGGRATPVTKLDPAAGEIGHVTPWFLPDGRHFLFLAVTRKREKRAIWAASVNDGSRAKVITENSNAAFAAGHIFFCRDFLLMAQPFDFESRQVTGNSFVVARNVEMNPVSGPAAFTVSDCGTIIYGVKHEPVELVWLSPEGEVEGVAAPADDYRGYGLSPDGTRLAVVKRDQEGEELNAELLAIETANGRSSRVTHNFVRGAVWSPDGKRIAFASYNYDASADLRVISADGSGERIVCEAGGMPTSWSRDGRWLAFCSIRYSSQWDLYAVDLSDGEVIRVLQTPAAEWHGQFSPDGKWMAYVSNESGDREVYVRSFPHGDAKWKISTTGGYGPAWSPNGDRLFYGSDGLLLAVDVTVTGGDFHASSPVALFSLPFDRFSRAGMGLSGGGDGPMMGPGISVLRDGRFLVERSVAEKRSPTIIAILNWQPEDRTED